VLGSGGYASRVTFVIDKDGTVRKIFKVSNAGKHPTEVLAYIKENLTEK